MAALEPVYTSTFPQSVSVPNQGQLPIQTGWIAEQVLTGADGEIHYSYYRPENYDENKRYPMVVAMPGYDKMWFGEESAGRNLDWNGVQVWTEQEEDVIVVSAQLTDWSETSTRQSIELTEYFLQNFSVDKSRVYATEYSAGGETMSQAVSMRPDLYAAICMVLPNETGAMRRSRSMAAAFIKKAKLKKRQQCGKLIQPERMFRFLKAA